MIKKIKSKSININKKGQIINKNLKNELNNILMIIKIDIDKNLGQGRIKPESIVKIQEKIIAIFKPESADNTKVKESEKESPEAQENALPSAPTENNQVI